MSLLASVKEIPRRLIAFHVGIRYDCKYTGAVTTRTATLDGFDEDPGTHKVAFALGQTASLNSYGYSPHPLSKYLQWIETLYKNQNPDSKCKPIILSVAPTDAAQLGVIMTAIQGFRHSVLKTLPSQPVLAVELNTSCPNIPNHPPPAYDMATLTPLLQVLASTFQADPTLVIGLKLAPFVYRDQMEGVVRTIAGLVDQEGRSPIAFLTSTNTLGGCVMFADQVSQKTTSASTAGVDAAPSMALPTTFGGLAGEPLHYLSLGNIMTLSSMLASSPIPALHNVGIIGVGGVTTPAAYQRMRKAGAAAVACATALGINGVTVFERLGAE